MDDIKIEAIDLFCGIGGLSFGLQKAGITVKAGLDFDKSCQYAFERNINAPFIQADISKYDLSQLDDFYSPKSVKILVGCAPCQPFSTHTHKNKNKQNDERWNLVEYFLQAVRKLQPDLISMENVRGFAKTTIFESFVCELEKLNYHINHQIVFCPDYGIPQNRSRLVLLGSRNFKISLPKKTHSKKQYVTVCEVIKNLPRLTAGKSNKNDSLHRAKGLSDTNIERIKQSKQKGTWRDWDKSLLPNCYRKVSGQSYTSVYGRMSWNNPAPTITTQFFNYGSGRFGHPTQNRGLSLREGALLQTFPKEYDFGNQYGLQILGRHIGNAVPPKLGKVIGDAIINSLEKTKCQT